MTMQTASLILLNWTTRIYSQIAVRARGDRPFVSVPVTTI